APSGATRLTGMGRRDPDASLPDEWFELHPGNVSPFVAYLSTEDCPIHGRVFFVHGGEVYLFQPFVIVDKIVKEGDFWTVEELQEQARRFQEYEFDYGHPFGQMLFRGPAAASGSG